MPFRAMKYCKLFVCYALTVGQGESFLTVTPEVRTQSLDMLLHKPLAKTDSRGLIHNLFAKNLQELGKARLGKFLHRFTESRHALTDNRRCLGAHDHREFLVHEVEKVWRHSFLRHVRLFI